LNNPEAAPGRTAGSRIRPVRALLLAAAALLILLSWKQFFFLGRVIEWAATPEARTELRRARIARLCLDNPRAAPLAEPHLRRPEFLRSLTAEALLKGGPRALAELAPPIRDALAARFPANLFFRDWGIFPRRAPAGGSVFDPMFLNLAGDDRLNPFTGEILARALREGLFSSRELGVLIPYLNWKKNFAPAEAALETASRERLLPRETIELLRTDAERRRRGPPEGPFRRTRADPVPPEDLAEIAGFPLTPLSGSLLPADNPEAEASENGPWRFYIWSGGPRIAVGTYAGGPDFLPETGGCLRILGFSSGAEPGKEKPRAGFILRNARVIEKDVYAFYFRYTTAGDDEIPAFRLAHGLKTWWALKPSPGQWKEVLLLFDNSRLGMPDVGPILFLFETGGVWFDGPALYRVETSVENHEGYSLHVR
jgi:hypothetical protein